MQHAVEPDDALIPPVAEQLGVQRAHADATVRDPLGDRRYEDTGVGPGPHQCPGVVVGAAVDPPGPVPMGGVAVVVAIRRAGGIAARAPHPVDRLPVDRPQDRTVRSRERRQVCGIVPAKAAGQLDAARAHAGRLQRRVQPLGVGALGQPQATPPGAKPPAVRRDPGLQLQRQPGVGGHQREHRMAGRRRPARMRAQGPEQPRTTRALERLQPVRRGRVLGNGAIELGGQAGLPSCPQLGGVTAVGLGADLAQEGQAALHRPGVLELVAQHRGQRQGQRRRVVPIEHVEQRQVTRGDRLPQQFLAEWPGPEALHIGHVRVQDDRQLALRHRRKRTGPAPVHPAARRCSGAVPQSPFPG